MSVVPVQSPGVVLVATKLHAPDVRPGIVAARRARRPARGGAHCRLVAGVRAGGLGEDGAAGAVARRGGRDAAVRVGLARRRRRRARALLELRRRGAADGRARVRRRGAGALPNAGPALVEVVLPRLINELAELPEPVVLVLDDYHLLQRRARARVGRLPAAAPAAHAAARAREPRRPAAAARAPARRRRAGRGPRRRAAVRRRRGRRRCSTGRSRSASTPATSSCCRSAPRAGPPGLQLAALSLRGRSGPRARSSARSRATTGRSATTCTR